MPFSELQLGKRVLLSVHASKEGCLITHMVLPKGGPSSKKLTLPT